MSKINIKDVSKYIFQIENNTLLVYDKESNVLEYEVPNINKTKCRYYKLKDCFKCTPTISQYSFDKMQNTNFRNSKILECIINNKKFNRRQFTSIYKHILYINKYKNVNELVKDAEDNNLKIINILNICKLKDMKLLLKIRLYNGKVVIYKN